MIVILVSFFRSLSRSLIHSLDFFISFSSSFDVVEFLRFQLFLKFRINRILEIHLFSIVNEVVCQSRK